MFLAAAGMLTAAGTVQADPLQPRYGIRAAEEQRLAITAGDWSGDVSLQGWRQNLDQLWEQVGGDEFFQLRNTRSGECLAIPYGDPERLVSQYDCNAEYADQWWRWIEGVDGLQLQNLETMLVAAPERPLPGSPIVQLPPGSPDADWVVD